MSYILGKSITHERSNILCCFKINVVVLVVVWFLSPLPLSPLISSSSNNDWVIMFLRNKGESHFSFHEIFVVSSLLLSMTSCWVLVEILCKSYQLILRRRAREKWRSNNSSPLLSTCNFILFTCCSYIIHKDSISFVDSLLEWSWREHIYLLHFGARSMALSVSCEFNYNENFFLLQNVSCSRYHLRLSVRSKPFRVCWIKVRRDVRAWGETKKVVNWGVEERESREESSCRVFE